MNPDGYQSASSEEDSPENLEALPGNPFCRVLEGKLDSASFSIGCTFETNDQSLQLAPQSWNFASQDFAGRLVRKSHPDWSFYGSIESDGASPQGIRISFGLESLDNHTFSLKELIQKDPLQGGTPPVYYRLVFERIATPCEEKAIHLSDLTVLRDGETLVNSFVNVPETNESQANVGTIGDHVASLSSSGSFSHFLEFEAFGGGQENGWWSAESSFIDGQAQGPVWFQIQFFEPAPWIEATMGGTSTRLLPTNL